MWPLGLAAGGGEAELPQYLGFIKCLLPDPEQFPHLFNMKDTIHSESGCAAQMCRQANRFYRSDLTSVLGRGSSLFCDRVLLCSLGSPPELSTLPAPPEWLQLQAGVCPSWLNVAIWL